MPVVRGPQLEGAALAAVRHRGSHLQIIASAGSGKTEILSQRVADLLADGVAAGAIVASPLRNEPPQSFDSGSPSGPRTGWAERRPLPLPATPGRR